MVVVGHCWQLELVRGSGGYLTRRRRRWKLGAWLAEGEARAEVVVVVVVGVAEIDWETGD